MTTHIAETPLAEEPVQDRPLLIDADSHLEDGPEVFDYIDAEFEHRRPIIVDIGGAVRHRPTRNKAWLVDGEMRPKFFGPGPSAFASPPNSDWAKSKPVPPGVQSLTDIDGLLATMDQVPLDKIIVYSTLFLHPLTEDPRFEAALMASWNTYMHERAAAASGRLGFGALIPTRDPHLGAAQIKRAKELGAASVMLLPAAGHKMLHDRSLDPLWEAATAHDMPVSVHVGWAFKGIQDSCDCLAASMVLNFEMSMAIGMFSFLAGGILDRFPTLRVAFLEAGTVWLPALLDRIEKWRKTPTAEIWPAQRSPEEYLSSGQVFFTVEGDEDNLIEFIGERGHRQILGSADFPHVHYAGAKLGQGFTMLRDHDQLSDLQKKEILGGNASRFYGLKA
ncbi:amidohydrolase family protein [Streptomyces sp. 4F14]|uniref:amidohydrolase family protein n=1 Tax=Streptomyces sp. 4F14 TaxID=3394380 RepID=UPI003A8C6A95